MLDVHEFSGTMTYETNYGVESIDFAYNIFVAEDADPDLIEDAARSIARFIVMGHIDGENTPFSMN
jgi:hypothetical protein